MQLETERGNQQLESKLEPGVAHGIAQSQRASEPPGGMALANARGMTYSAQLGSTLQAFLCRSANFAKLSQSWLCVSWTRLLASL